MRVSDIKIAQGEGHAREAKCLYANRLFLLWPSHVHISSCEISKSQMHIFNSACTDQDSFE